MRVALLYPEVYDMARFKERRKEFPPFGVLYLAAVLRQRDHEVAILRVTRESYTLDLTGFDAVGFSLASSATYGIMLAARRASQYADGALLMAGGIHANFYPVDTLRDFDVDVVGVGEGEDLLPEILEHAIDRDFSKLAGATYRDGRGEVCSNPSRQVTRDISHLPLPARDLLPFEDVVIGDRLAGRELPMAHVMFSRGCPFPCSFCAAGQTRIQYRDGRSARTELIHLQESYGIGGFAIVDDNFIVAKEKVRDICRNVADLGLSWSALSRVDTVDLPLLNDMASAGCIEVKFGVESGSESLLRRMRKNTTRADVVSAIQSARQAGIEAKAFIIHGYPGENLATTRETISLLEELGPRLSRVSLFRFVPLPGTQVYANARLEGIHGTHLEQDWDGDWEKFHIHHNERHWWGNDADYAELQEAYCLLQDFVERHWNVQG